MIKLPDRHALSIRLMPEAYQKLHTIREATGLTMNTIVSQLIINVEVDTINAEEIQQKNAQLKDLQDQVDALKTQILKDQTIKFIVKES
jgi:predicted DNA-binding protein